MKKLNFGESDAIKTLRGFVIGVAFTLTVLGALWIKNHYRAIVMAVYYPEAVETLQVTKNYKVEKLTVKK